MEELVSGLLRPKLFPFGKLSKAKPAAQVEYIPNGSFRSSFKFCMGDKLREKMEGGKKRDETFFGAL